MIANFIETNIDVLKDFVQNSNIFIALIIGMSLIILESIIPMLPLAVFIAINMLVFGNIIGFILSWISTNKAWKYISKKEKLVDLMKKIDKISFSSLVIILAFPFTPAFSINIGAGLSNISYKKYLLALLISKISIVYFWGFIGTTLVESITDIGVLLKIAVIILIAFILSKIVTKKFNIN
mgnify:CR=1 FL=1